MKSSEIALSQKMNLENAIEYQSSEIQYGYELITNTDQLIGMAVDDESMRYTGNVLRCSSCHLQGGTQSYGIALVGVTTRFPQFRGRENKEGTLSERINGCMTRSMNGKPLPEDGKEMKAMLAYISWLDDYFGEEASSVSPGLKPIELPNRAVDLAKGESHF
jgi:thiosulfate dehydrogenase